MVPHWSSVGGMTSPGSAKLIHFQTLSPIMGLTKVLLLLDNPVQKPHRYKLTFMLLLGTKHLKNNDNPNKKESSKQHWRTTFGHGR